MFWADRGKFDKAETFHRKAIARSEELVRLYPVPSSGTVLTQSYTTLATMYLVQQQAKKAEEIYRKAVVLQEALVKDTAGHPLVSFGAGGNLLELWLALEPAKPRKRLAVYQKGRDLLEPLVRRVSRGHATPARSRHLQQSSAAAGGSRRSAKALSCRRSAVEVICCPLPRPHQRRLHFHLRDCSERRQRRLG